MPITPVQAPNVLGSYIQGLEMGRQARAQRAKETQTAELQNMLRAATPEQLQDPGFINQLLVRPGGAEFAKPLAESLSARQGMRKSELEVMKMEVERLAGEAGSFLQAYQDNPASLNKAAIAPWLNSAVRRGLMNPEDLQTFEAMPDDPQQLASRLQQLQTQGMTIADQLQYQRPKGTTSQVGGMIVTVDPYTGKEIGSVDYRAAEQTARAAGAPSTKIQTFLPASETAQTEFIKEFRDTYKQLKTAPTDIANLRRAGELAKTEARKFMGTGGQAFLSAAKFLKNRLGVDVDDKAIAGAEEARTVLFQNVLNNLRKLDAQPSQEQQRIMQEALGNLDTDPDALPRVVQVYEDVIRGRVEQHNREFSEMKANPNLANAFPYSLEIKLPERIAAPPSPAGAPGAGGQVVDVRTPEEARKLAPGTRFRTPDGRIKVR
jgi:hypothetical protein